MEKIAKKSVFKSQEGCEQILNYYSRMIEQWPVENERRVITASHYRTHLIISGDEAHPPLLLLHGTAGNSSAWLGDVEALSRRFRVIAADMPGEPGLSEDARMSPAGDDYARWIEALLDELKLGKVGLAGMSLGGFAALKFAVRFPERVSFLSLVCASGLAPARISFLFKAMPLMMLGRWGSDRNYRLISYGQSMPEEVYEFGRLVSKYYKPMLEPIPVLSDDELRRLHLPVQYFGGDHDALLNTKASAGRLHELLPGAEVNVLAETGHVITGITDRIIEFAVRASVIEE